MAATPNLPYVLAAGRISPLLEKIQQAQVPTRFTQDFLDTKLGMRGGSATPLIPLLKRIGFLENDGSPTELYRKYRNPETAGAALAAGLRKGYSELFSRNEYVNELTRGQLTNMVVEITGKTKDHRTVKGIVGTFWALKEKADFDSALQGHDEKDQDKSDEKVESAPSQAFSQLPITMGHKLGLNLSYTINLNLPETDDINVYNAIFKSLKENMLKD